MPLRRGRLGAFSHPGASPPPGADEADELDSDGSGLIVGYQGGEGDSEGEPDSNAKVSVGFQLIRILISWLECQKERDSEGPESDSKVIFNSGLHSWRSLFL